MVIKLLATLRLKLNFDKLWIPLAILLSLTIFLTIILTSKAFFIVISIIIALTILFLKPWFLVLTVAVFALIFLVYYLLRAPLLSFQIHSNLRVYGLTKFGPLVKYENLNLVIPTNETFNLYDQIQVQGLVKPIAISNALVSWTDYFYGMNVMHTIETSQLVLVGESQDVRKVVANYLLDGPLAYQEVIPLLILGIKDGPSASLYQNAQTLGVAHIFAISGFHLVLVHRGFKFLAQKLAIPNSWSSYLGLVLIATYVFFLDFPPSALRALIFITISTFNAHLLKSRFCATERMAFVLGIMLIINPFYVHAWSFIFSFISAFVIGLIQDFKFKKKWTKRSCLVFVPYLFNLVFATYLNKSLPILGLVFTTFLTPFFVALYTIGFLFLPWKDGLVWFCEAFLLVIDFLKQVNVLVPIRWFSDDLVYSFYGMFLTGTIMLIWCDWYMVKKNSWLIRI